MASTGKINGIINNTLIRIPNRPTAKKLLTPYVELALVLLQFLSKDLQV